MDQLIELVQSPLTVCSGEPGPKYYSVNVYLHNGGEKEIFAKVYGPSMPAASLRAELLCHAVNKIRKDNTE